ncbi:MAG: sugar phosphate isomerase/epimerase [Clostridia bacterium]|nr:sugar phosphate isomerase/epimerase [Clostridia bacterium]
MFSIGIYTDFVNLPDVAHLGFDYLELPLDALAALPESDFRQFADYADGQGLRIGAMSRLLPGDLPITGSGVNATALHGYLSHAMSRARRLGARILVLDAAKSRSVPEDGDYPFAWRQLGNFLRLIQGHAKECGMKVALMPLRKADCSLLNLVSEATLIAGLLQLDNVCVAAHWGHMSMASEPMSALRRAAPLLGYVQLENALNRALPRPGDGEDYGRLLGTLADIGYSGGVTLCGAITDAFPRDAEEALAYIRNTQKGAYS